MIALQSKRVMILGRDPSGEAAAALVRTRGGEVTWAAPEDMAPGVDPDLVVVSATCGRTPAWLRELAGRGVAVLAERELAYQCSLCLHVAIAGTSGKSTTAQLIAHILRGAGRRVAIADRWERPACSLVEASRELDFLIHVVGSSEPEHFVYFRPVVGVLLNASVDVAGMEGTHEDFIRRLARLFAVQQAFDWAIVQSEAMARLQASGVVLPGKQITFSSSSRQADLREDRGLLVSRIEGWSGPLWDLARGRMSGSHFAEDALAALAVGRVLRLTLEQMLPALATFETGPGRMELLGEVDGVRYVDDSRASSLDALARALLTLAPTQPDRAFICLVAGGDSAGRQFYDLGPLISPRVRQAFVHGEAAPAMCAAWSLFAPCVPVGSLLEAAQRAVAQSEPGDVVLYSPACPSREKILGPPTAGAAFREEVRRRLDQGTRVPSGIAADATATGDPSSVPNPVES